MNKESETADTSASRKRFAALALCTACIFFGSCAENVMSNWISGYIEIALGIDKALGDILGVAMFAILLGIARILYARYGKNIFATLLFGMAAASICYLVVGFTGNGVLALVCAVLIGFFTSMLWPGSLIMMEENVKGAGVTAFALMAAGGDLGASVAPQLMGIVIDSVSVSSFAADMSVKLGISAEQVGLKAGMIITSLFPIIGCVLLVFVIGFFKKNKDC